MRISTNKAELDQLVQAVRGATVEHEGHVFPAYPLAQMVEGIEGADGTLRVGVRLKGVGPLSVELALEPDGGG